MTFMHEMHSKNKSLIDSEVNFSLAITLNSLSFDIYARNALKKRGLTKVNATSCACGVWGWQKYYGECVKSSIYWGRSYSVTEMFPRPRSISV